MEWSTTARRLLDDECRRRLCEQGPLGFASISSEDEKHGGFGQGNLLPGKLDGSSVPSGSDVRPAAVLVFQPQASCLVDKHRHNKEERQ